MRNKDRDNDKDDNHHRHDNYHTSNTHRLQQTKGNHEGKETEQSPSRGATIYDLTNHNVRQDGETLSSNSSSASSVSSPPFTSCNVSSKKLNKARSRLPLSTGRKGKDGDCGNTSDVVATARTDSSRLEFQSVRVCGLSMYRDFSWVPAPSDASKTTVAADDSAGSVSTSENSNHVIENDNKAAKEPTFPVKLHMILSSPEYEDIIAWLPHGRSWRILQQKAFEDKVIPNYFWHSRFSSFARQVTGWGFQRVTHGSDYNSYYHELFLRGMPYLCHKMRRLTKSDGLERKKNAVRKDSNSNSDDCPDFYEISKRHPLPDTRVFQHSPTSSVPNETTATEQNARPPLNKRRRRELLSGQRFLEMEVLERNIRDNPRRRFEDDIRREEHQSLLFRASAGTNVQGGVDESLLERRRRALSETLPDEDERIGSYSLGRDVESAPNTCSNRSSSIGIYAGAADTIGSSYSSISRSGRRLDDPDPSVLSQRGRRDGRRSVSGIMGSFRTQNTRAPHHSESPRLTRQYSEEDEEFFRRRHENDFGGSGENRANLSFSSPIDSNDLSRYGPRSLLRTSTSSAAAVARRAPPHIEGRTIAIELAALAQRKDEILARLELSGRRRRTSDDDFSYSGRTNAGLCATPKVTGFRRDYVGGSSFRSDDRQYIDSSANRRHYPPGRLDDLREDGRRRNPPTVDDTEDQYDYRSIDGLYPRPTFTSPSTVVTGNYIGGGFSRDRKDNRDGIRNRREYPPARQDELRDTGRIRSTTDEGIGSLAFEGRSSGHHPAPTGTKSGTVVAGSSFGGSSSHDHDYFKGIAFQRDLPLGQIDELRQDGRNRRTEANTDYYDHPRTEVNTAYYDRINNTGAAI